MDDGPRATSFVNRQRLLSALGAAIGLVGIAFVAIKVNRDWDQFTDALAEARPGWLVGGAFAGTSAIVGIGVNWSSIIGTRGTSVPIGAGLRWFLIGQLGKYVPGGIWPVVGQAELAARGGVPRGDAYSATVLSMATTLSGAAVVAAATGIGSPNDRLLIGSGLAVLLGFGAVAIRAGRLRSALDRVAARVTRGRVALPTLASLAAWTGRHVPVWIAFSAVNVFVVVALRGPHGGGLIVDIAFATCVSWMAGFVIVGLPGGLGVREAVFVSLMTAPLGAGLAVSVAVVGRLVSIAVDVAAAATVSLATIGRSWPGPSD